MKYIYSLELTLLLLMLNPWLTCKFTKILFTMVEHVYKNFDDPQSALKFLTLNFSMTQEYWPVLLCSKVITWTLRTVQPQARINGNSVLMLTREVSWFDLILILVSALSIGTHRFWLAKTSLDIFFKPVWLSSNAT